MKTVRRQERRNTAAAWASLNPILADSEIGVVTDATPRTFKIGDGVTAWNALAYSGGGTDQTARDAAAAALLRANHTGTQSADTIIDGTANKAFTAAEKTKLAGAALASDLATEIANRTNADSALAGTIATAQARADFAVESNESTQADLDSFQEAAEPAIAALQTGLAAKSPLASPAFTGTPTAPTPVNATDSTQLATTAFVHAIITALLGTAPANLDTLGEIAAQLASDESALAALITTVSGKLAKAANLSDLTDAAAALTNLGGSTIGKSIFTAANLAAIKTILALVKADVGLANVDNTSDANKPVSTAQATAIAGKEASQTAASQAEAEAGTETAIRKWSPLRIAQAIEALGAGGGGSVADAGVYWVNAISGGSDTTGDGSPSAPFATAQKAYAVAQATALGAPLTIRAVGDVGPITGAALNLTLIGVGKDRTTFGNSFVGGITGASGYVRGNGRHMVSTGPILIQPATAAKAANGVTATSEEAPFGGAGNAGGTGVGAEATFVEGLTTTNIFLRGGVGQEGGNGGDAVSGIEGASATGGDAGSGGAGGSGARLTVRNCEYISAQSLAGEGNSAGSPGNGASGGSNGSPANSGDAGSGAELYMENCEETGSHAAPSVNGGGAVSGGAAGAAGTAGLVRGFGGRFVGVAFDAAETRYQLCLLGDAVCVDSALPSGEQTPVTSVTTSRGAVTAIS